MLMIDTAILQKVGFSSSCNNSCLLSLDRFLCGFIFDYVRLYICITAYSLRKYINKKRCLSTSSCLSLRKEGDSNPRYPNRVRQFSKLVVSATHPSFLTEFSVKEWCKGRQKKLLCKISVAKIFINVEKCLILTFETYLLLVDRVKIGFRTENNGYQYDDGEKVLYLHQG